MYHIIWTKAKSVGAREKKKSELQAESGLGREQVSPCGISWLSHNTSGLNTRPTSCASPKMLTEFSRFWTEIDFLEQWECPVRCTLPMVWKKYGGGLLKRVGNSRKRGKNFSKWRSSNSLFGASSGRLLQLSAQLLNFFVSGVFLIGTPMN